MAVTIPETAISPFLTGYNSFATPMPQADFRTFTAPLSNKGNPTSKIDKQQNTFAIMSGAPIRLVDNRTGQIAYEGSGYEGTQEAIRIAQELSQTFGKKASWELQTAPSGGDWTTVAKEKKNKSLLGAIADIALPIAASFIPGVGPIAGAALGSTASSVAQGRSIGDTLLRAGLAAGGSALGGAAFGKAAGGAGSAAGSTAGATAGSAAGSAAGSTLGSTAGSALGDIIVTAALPNVFASGVSGGLASGLIPSFFDSAQLSDVAPTQPAQQPTPEPAQPGDLIVTARPTPPAVNPFGPLGGSLASVIPPLLQPGAPPAAQTTPTTTDKNLIDRITANMGISDYLALAGLLGGAVAGSGGGGGAVATSPYTSLLGPAPTLGGAQTATTRQMNVPFAGDYEQYGFGPEYQFFKQPA